MKTLLMCFTVVCGAVLQAMLPVWVAMGHAKVPLLLGLPWYHALNGNRRLMWQSAILAGLFQDGLSMIPLGYSSFVFCVVGVIVQRFRDLVFVQRGVTHALIGGAAAAGVTVLLFLLLARGDSFAPPLSWMLLKVLGNMLLAMLVMPLLFSVLHSMDRRWGYTERRYA